MDMDMGHDDPDTGSDSNSSPMSMMSMMQMSFYWGKRATILFSGWKTSSVGNYVGSLLALLVIAFLYQYLERLTSSASPLIPQPRRRPAAHAAAGAPKMAQQSANVIDDDDAVKGSRTPLTTKLLLTLIFGIRVGLAYLLMLAVMSFNAGVFIAVVLGFSVGFFVFRSDIHSPKSASVSPATSATDSHA
ncbi:hypothetical protein L7F22_059076 [Adiantum nelumboides]|nr:hypothetical protein [Adiantum nelumboides]